MLDPKEKIIVSADDFGKDDLTNENILKLIKLGKVDRVAILAKGKISRLDIKSLLDSKVKLDVHLDLGRNLRYNAGENQSVFGRLSLFLGSYLFSRKTRTARVEKEWEAQILAFQKLFSRLPDGANSHQHIHFFPPYFKIFLKLCAKFNISYIRYGKNPLKEKTKVSFILNCLKKVNDKFFLASGRDTSEFLLSADWVRDFGKFLADLPEPGRVEMVCHFNRTKEFDAIIKYL